MNKPSIHYRTIIESEWQSILRIQAEVYYAIVPESESVMRSKANCSPETCSVAADSDERVLGYCLAYPYPLDQIPSLGVQLARGTNIPAPATSTANLFLHDLAVDKSSGGRGIAQSLFQQVTVAARTLGYTTMSLVAIQQASGFWSKLGFTPVYNTRVDSSYATDAQFMSRNL